MDTKEQDIKEYLRANKQQKKFNLLVTLANLAFAAVFVLEARYPGSDYIFGLCIFCFLILVAALGGNNRVMHSRKDLLDIIQRQINGDPESIALLAQLKAK